MQVFVQNGFVVAWHEDGQTLPADAYPGARRMLLPDAFEFERLGEVPEEGEPDTRSFKAPVPSVDDLRRYTADKRWRVETGGVSVGGIAVHTDDRSKMMIMGARVKAAADPLFTTQWKTVDGAFVTIDALTVVALSDAVLAHVDACFAAEATVLAGIDAGTINDLDGIDDADWPES
jgi:hypothetical protein